MCMCMCMRECVVPELLTRTPLFFFLMKCVWCWSRTNPATGTEPVPQLATPNYQVLSQEKMDRNHRHSVASLHGGGGGVGAQPKTLRTYSLPTHSSPRLATRTALHKQAQRAKSKPRLLLLRMFPTILHMLVLCFFYQKTDGFRLMRKKQDKWVWGTANKILVAKKTASKRDFAYGALLLWFEAPPPSLPLVRTSLITTQKIKSKDDGLTRTRSLTQTPTCEARPGSLGISRTTRKVQFPSLAHALKKRGGGGREKKKEKKKKDNHQTHQSHYSTHSDVMFWRGCGVHTPRTYTYTSTCGGGDMWLFLQQTP